MLQWRPLMTKWKESGAPTIACRSAEGTKQIGEFGVGCDPSFSELFIFCIELVLKTGYLNLNWFCIRAMHHGWWFNLHSCIHAFNSKPAYRTFVDKSEEINRTNISSNRNTCPPWYDACPPPQAPTQKRGLVRTVRLQGFRGGRHAGHDPSRGCA